MGNLIKMFKVALLVATFASSTALLANEALEDGRDKCGVPVCDVDATLEVVRNDMWSDKRGEYANSLIKQYKDVSDEASLLNLYDFATKYVALCEELLEADGDWVVRAAKDFHGVVLTNLSQNSEVKAEKLVKYFYAFNSQYYRNKMIEYWAKQAAEVENVSVLEELITFATSAREHVRIVGDEDWVGRNATYMINRITSRIADLDPSLEGVYDVTIESGLEGSVASFDKVVVMKSAANDKLMVSFVNTKHYSVTRVYNFSKSEIDGNNVRGMIIDNGSLGSSQFLINYDRKERTISGSLVSTSMMEPVEFSGVQKRTIKEVFDSVSGAEGVVAENVMGFYNGSFGNVQGVLSIKSFVSGVYSATFRASNGVMIVHFQGKYFPGKSVLTLSSARNDMKMNLAIKENSGEISATGFAYSALVAKDFEVSFVK